MEYLLLIIGAGLTFLGGNILPSLIEYQGSELGIVLACSGFLIIVLSYFMGLRGQKPVM